MFKLDRPETADGGRASLVNTHQAKEMEQPTSSPDVQISLFGFTYISPHAELSGIYSPRSAPSSGHMPPVADADGDHDTSTAFLPAKQPQINKEPDSLQEVLRPPEACCPPTWIMPTIMRSTSPDPAPEQEEQRLQAEKYRQEQELASALAQKLRIAAASDQRDAAKGRFGARPATAPRKGPPPAADATLYGPSQPPPRPEGWTFRKSYATHPAPYHKSIGDWLREPEKRGRVDIAVRREDVPAEAGIPCECCGFVPTLDKILSLTHFVEREEEIPKCKAEERANRAQLERKKHQADLEEQEKCAMKRKRELVDEDEENRAQKKMRVDGAGEADHGDGNDGQQEDKKKSERHGPLPTRTGES